MFKKSFSLFTLLVPLGRYTFANNESSNEFLTLTQSTGKRLEKESSLTVHC